ncbi:porin [Sphaerotilus uruguayifluvii]|uniref:Porin n=1 Tax=Sphaerotilus uruguayifluvii TaxID=2735897 RepID=A0ABX2G822_9BURK|nr:porin [Leptothrix sp. C29]NRT58487.1 putative porin [Leptothrix sp. C29]
MKRFRPTPIRHALGVMLLGLLAAGQAEAVSFTQGDVTLDISGTVNGFYVNRSATVTTKATGAESKSDNSAISNGLLPGWIHFTATAKAGEQNVKADISFAPGINSTSSVVGLPIGDNSGGASPATPNPYSQIDTRSAYFQFGNDGWGTIKFGRDIGLFGQNIVLSDMTLLGVGGTTNASIPFNTTFGMIGHGYMYVGFQPQITYTTPKTGGVQAAAGIFQPSRFAGNQTRTPGVQAMLSYDWSGPAAGKVWTGLVHQSTSCSGTCTSQPFTANGMELGAKVGFGDAEAVLYGFKGKGLGLSTVGAQFLGGADAAGNRTDSKGYLAQVTYKITGDTKVGVNYGKNTDSDGAVGAGNSIYSKGLTLGVYHTLNKYITLTGELNQERKDNVATKEKNRSISLGGVLFF